MNRKGLSLMLAILLALFLLPALLSIFGRAQSTHAATFSVTVFFDENDSVCDSSCSLRDAISAAGNGDDITIPAGTYTLSATNGTLTVTENLVFNGNSASDTFIDAQGNSRVFNVTAGTVAFNDLTIQNGISVDGAGIRISGATTNVTLNNTTVYSNSATTNGGGIYLQSGALTLQDSNVFTNTAVSDGGGIYTLRGAVTLNNSNIDYNDAGRAGGIFVNQESANLTFNSGEIAYNTGSSATDTFPGGGVFVGSGSATLNGGEIKFNQAFRGGGILVSSGQVTMNDAQIISNTATYGGGVYVVNTTGWFTQTAGLIATNQSTATVDFGGGGLYIFNGNVNLLGGSVMANTAVYHGGGMEVRFGTLLVDGATISDNQAGQMGGGIYNSDGVADLTNVTLSGNTASGGAGFATGLTGSSTLTNVTLSENAATSSGGGLSNSGGTLIVGNTIIYGNSAPSGADCSGTITSAGDNISTCSLGGSGDSASDPLLQPLALNDGNTLNYALGASSPAIDTGSNTLCPATDQRGNLRPVDGNGDSSATCDIGAYEDGIAFFISDASLTEGDTGSSQMSFVVTRSFITDTTYTVDYETITGTATANIDFTHIPTATLTFLPATMTQTISIDILGDTVDEVDEQFTVQLSNQSPEIQVGDFNGTGTILDDDAPPSLTINDVTISEGNSGTITAVFTATLSAPSGKTITVDYETMNGTAEAGSDYTAVLPTTLTFNPGDTEKSFNIAITGDTIDEFDETFTVELSNESNVTLADSSGQATITDDDLPPTLTITDVSVTEANSGTTSANFVVTLSTPSSKTITVNYMTAAGSATEGTDYAFASGTITFTPGNTEETISVLVNGDVEDEDNETFVVTLSGAIYVTVIDSEATGTIIDNDNFIYLPLLIKP